MDSRSLERRFARLRRRMLLVSGLAGVGWALVAAAVLLLVLVWLDLVWELSPQARIGFGAIVLLAVAAGIAARLYAALAGASPGALARRLDRAANTGGQILSGYDLARPAARNAASEPVTQGLAEMAVERASSLAAGVPARQVVPTRGLLRMSAGLLGAGLALVGLVPLFPALAQTEWLRFMDPFGDHPPYSRITFRVEPGNAKVLYGDGLDVFVTTQGPPTDRVELVVWAGDAESAEDAEVLPMFHEPAGRWRTVLARVTSDARYHVRSGRSRSHQYSIDVITTPKLVDVQFRITPPEYSRRGVYQGRLPQGGIAGLAGTSVQVTARSNRPLSRGKATVTSGGQTADFSLVPGSSESVTGSFEIRASGKLELGVTDVDGRDSSEKLAASIVLVPDENPFIRILQPPAHAFATPEATLPVSVSAEDDCGISRVQLFRSLNESRALPMEFDVPPPAPLRYDGQQALPLSAYGLAPGDVIKLFARVEDNDPAGAKGAESPIVTVQIISQQDFERMVRIRQGLEALSSKYRQAERRLESLAAEQEGLRKELEKARDGKLSESAREALRRLSKRLRKESEDIRASAEHLLPFDLDAALVSRLLELAESLEHESGSLEALDLENLSPEEAQKLLDQLLQKLAGDKKQFDEEAIAPLEHLELIYPLIEDQSRFVALYEQSRDLAQRLASLKGIDRADDPQVKARMRTMEEEQSRLREALAELLDDIENHALRLPDDERLDDLRATALSFADAVRASGASEAMLEAETALADFSGTEGHAASGRAADILEEFLAKCEGMGNQGQLCLKFQPSLESGLGHTIEQLLNEAGLGSGGMGGGQSGYSTRRSTLDSVGLFGNLPGTDQMPGRTSQRSAPADRSQHPSAGSGDDAEIVSGQSVRAAAGSSGAGVPPRYRGRVGAYFRRIAEEGQPR